jgi:hypothetical protein
MRGVIAAHVMGRQHNEGTTFPDGLRKACGTLNKGPEAVSTHEYPS